MHNRLRASSYISTMEVESDSKYSSEAWCIWNFDKCMRIVPSIILIGLLYYTVDFLSCIYCDPWSHSDANDVLKDFCWRQRNWHALFITWIGLLFLFLNDSNCGFCFWSFNKWERDLCFYCMATLNARKFKLFSSILAFKIHLIFLWLKNYNPF